MEAVKQAQFIIQHHEHTLDYNEASFKQRLKPRVPSEQFIVKHYEHLTGYAEELFKQRVQTPLSDSDFDEDDCGCANQNHNLTQEGVWATFMCEQIASRPTATCIDLLDELLDHFCSQEEQCQWSEASCPEVCSWGMKFLTDLGYDLHNAEG